MKTCLVFNKVWRGNQTGDGISQSSFTARMIALQSFIQNRGGQVIEVQDDRWTRSRISRLVRPLTVIRQIDKAQPDLVVVQFPNYPFFWSLDRDLDIRRSLWFARMLHSLCKRRNIYHILDYRDIIDNPKPNSVKAAFLEFALTSPDEIWASSPAFGRMAVEQCGVEPSRVRSVINGSFPVDGDTSVDSARPAGYTRFVYAGDLRPKYRGIEETLQSFSACPDVKCELLLCGHNGDWLRSQQLDPRVRLLGELPRSEVLALLKSSDIGLIPNPFGQYDANFPTKLGEYICSGLAILCSDTGVISDHVKTHGVGICAPFAEWPSAIRTLAIDTEFREGLRKKSQSRSQDMLWDNILSCAYASVAEIVSSNTSKHVSR